MYGDKTLKTFLEETGSRSHIPGGGAIAAMSSAAAAALTEMVANLTIGNKNYNEVKEEVEEILQKLSHLRNKFIEDIDEDAKAFDNLINSYRLPKGNTDEDEYRKNEIQNNLKKAALVPLELAKDTFNMMELIKRIVEIGNKNAITDVAIAAMMSKTAILSSLYNVKININLIKDHKFGNEIKEEIMKLEEGATLLEKSILDKVKL